MISNSGNCIYFSSAPCSFGTLLVAATEQGICAVSLGDSTDAIVDSLERAFPKAVLQNDESRLTEPMKILLQHLEGRQPHLDLPLDVRATAFQWRVWEVLRAIPYGETRTYSQIAQAMAQPNAVRAVARACATNSTALLIPCHRAVRSDGSPSGYRWGLERKHRLLQQEMQYSLRQRQAQ